MKNYRVVIALALAALVSGTALVPDTASAQTIGFGVNPQGSLYHRVGSAISKLMNDKMSTKVRVQPFSGSSTYIPLLNRDEVRLALVTVSDTVNATEGVDNFKGRPQSDLRLINVMFLLRFGILVPNDSPVKKAADLKGMLMPAGFTSQTTLIGVMKAMLASAGLTPADIKPYPTPNVFKGVALLGEGKVQAVTVAAGIAATQKANIKLRSHGGVRFVSLGSNIAAMNAVVPSSPITVNPAPHLKGVLEPTEMMAFRVFLTTNAKASDEFVYKLIKLLHGNKKTLVGTTKALGTFNPKQMAFNVNGKKGAVPYHPGAIKFLKEIGQWPSSK
ncbi:MAG: TAXI family TRAP transporter solute-binding subunit [Rhodospirillaceae bacterium]|nr:TAXI family TRAP transporter solute-binding subunit [Rhodospirillaceae bacterium]MBT7265850.1 TAXI family TRAP transporter solute-binding subunit [Rhodospirillaceae bacterium]